MPRFEVQGPDGAVYEVDAENETMAAKAIQGIESAVRGAMPGPISGDDASSALASFLKGVPVAGAYVEPAAAALEAATHPLLRQGDSSSTYSERYEKNLKRERTRNAKFEKDHPWMSTGLELAGGVAGTLPLLMVPGGATALGASGPMAARIGFGAASGAGLGAADSAARGNSATTGGWVGGAVGGAAPVAGKLAGAGVSKVANLLTGVPDELRGLSGGARNALVDTSSPATPSRLAELGPEGFMFEGNPATFQLTQGMVAARPGPAQAGIVSAVTTRDKGANARLKRDVDANLGAYEDPDALRAAILEERNKIAEGYAPAARGQQGLDLKPLLRQLDEEIAKEAGATKKALNEARGYLFGPDREMNPMGSPHFNPEVDTSSLPVGDKLKSDVYELHRVRIALDDLYGKLADTPVAQGRILKLRQQLDSLMPEQMKRVDKAMSQNFKREEALDIGKSKILRSGPDAMTPAQLQALEDAGAAGGGAITVEQARALQAGTRADVERMLGTTANDVAALRKAVGGDGDWNRAKLAQIFGADEADRVIGAVDREVAFKDAVTKLRDGAQTAQRQKAAKFVDDKLGPDAPSRSDMTVLGAVTAGLQKGYRALRDDLTQASRVRADEGLSRVLTMQGGERDRVVDALLDYATRRESAGRAAVPVDRIATILALNEGLQLPRQSGANMRGRIIITPRGTPDAPLPGTTR